MNDVAITPGDVMFFIAVMGAIGGLWWRVENAISNAKKEALTRAEAAAALATLATHQLAEHKVHVAENYITKAGLREQTEQIMSGVNSIKDSVERINERMDRVIEGRSKVGVSPPPRHPR